ncbi:MAG TPA: GIY-YIG nuclease family protein [Balneolaceae bacterium]|nr:GIY-YIG nuclease family protein [Balneolaceae bacterium]
MSKPKYLYHVYIMTNRWHSMLYTGMTGWGLLRIRQHIEKMKSGFTKRYNINKLVYLEEFTEFTDAIAREKQIKRWNRKKKEWLIEQQNPNWEDLFIKFTTRKQKGG